MRILVKIYADDSFDVLEQYEAALDETLVKHGSKRSLLEVSSDLELRTNTWITNTVVVRRLDAA